MTILAFIIYAIILFLISFYIVNKQKKRYQELLKEGKVKYEYLLKQYDDRLKQRIEEEKKRQLKEAASMTHHLSNVISGMNHEISPWIGGIKNKIARLSLKSKSSIIAMDVIVVKLNDILKACDSMSAILENLSRDVKKVQKYNIFRSNILETIQSWVRLTITDRSIKENLSEENFVIDNKTLSFNCNHAPMLVSQVILNLVKNSIDHNPEMLDKLKISIYGDPDMKAVIYEDNGKGIPEDMLDSIFTPGLTTKDKDVELHGLGLSLCLTYCLSMGAVIVAEPKNNGAKFVIYFESETTSAHDKTKVRMVKDRHERSTRMLCHLGDSETKK